MSLGPAGPAREVALDFEARIEAPRGRVFAALVEGRHLARWFCHAAESTPAPGGRLVLRWDRPDAIPFEGRWLEFDPPRACAYRGGNAGYPDGDGGLVRFTLAFDGETTVLHVHHTLPDRPGYEPFVALYRDAWPRALARLTAYLTPEA